MTKIKFAIITICLIISTSVVSAQDYNDLSSTQKNDIQEYFQANPGLTSAEKKAYIDGYIEASTNSEPSKEEASKEDAFMKQYQHNQRVDNRNQRQFNRTSRQIKKDYHDNTQNNSSGN